MKRRHANLWRSVISIVLTFVLVFGSVATAFAGTGGTNTATNTIKYVSLGDSMTNGYGLAGYDNQGYHQYGHVAYPNQLAEWIEKETGKKVEHNQLAISGMRVEDLLFALDFPMKNGEPDPAAVELAQRVSPVADRYTWWTETLAPEWYATFPVGDFWTWTQFTNGRFKNECDGTANAVKEYQKAITEADLISIGTGNSNFGAFTMDQLTKVMGFGGDISQTDWMDVDRALENCDPAMKPYFKALKSAIDVALAAETSTSEDEKSAEMMRRLVDVMTYTAISYVVNYAATMDKIMEMNPDAEIMLVGIMNTMAGVELTMTNADDEMAVPLKAMMGALVKPVNSYIASMPAELQETKPELYGKAKFYYAEAPEVECLVSTFGEAIKDPDSVVRQRFVAEIVGGGNGLIWNAVKPMFNEIKQLKGLTLQNITLEDIEAYEAGKISGFSNDKIISCAVYLALEDAIVRSSKESVVDIASFEALSKGFDSLIADISKKLINNKELAKITDINKYAKAMPKVMSDIIVSDNTMQGLMHMFARALIGTGIGAHPSENGHNELAAAVIKSYSEDYTAGDEKSIVENDLMALLLTESSKMFSSQKQVVHKLKKAVNNLDIYAKNELDNFTSNVGPAYKGKGFDAELNTAEKELKEMRKAVKDVKSAIGVLVSAVNGTNIKAVETAQAEVAAKMVVVDAAVPELDAAVNAAARKAAKQNLDNSALKAVASEMRSYVALAAATNGIMKGESREFAYAPTKDSYYVALGDSSTTSQFASNAYGRKLVKELNLDNKKNYTNEGIAGLRINDLMYILDETYETDAYGQAEFSGKADRIRDNLIAKIEKADLITVGFSNNTLLEIAIEQMIRAFGGKETYAVDWSRYLKEDMAVQVEAMMADIETTMAETTAGMSGSGINMANIGPAARAAIESYLYNYMGFYMDYQKTLNKITEINPDAKVVLIGIPNAFDGTTIVMGEKELPLGEYMGMLTNLMNLQQRGFAMMTGKATYVEANDVQVTNSAYAGRIQLMSFISQLIGKGISTLAPSPEGHTYIKDQIVSVMKVVDPQTESVMNQLAGLYDMLNINVNQLSEVEYQIKEARKAYDALNAEQKADVDADLVQMLKFCESDFDYVKVAAVGNSNVTNVKAKLPVKTKLTVSWTGISGAQKYAVKIYRNGKLYKTVNTTAKTATLKDIPRGCTYKVTVQPVAAINGISYTGIAKSASVTSKLDKASITAKKSGTKVKVSSKDQNSTGFQVWVSSSKTFKKNVTKKTFTTNCKALSNKVVALKKGTNYVKVRAYTTVNGKTVYGAWSYIKTIKR